MSAEFEPVFQTLRRVMLDYADGLRVTRDQPGDLVICTTTMDAKGEPGWFGVLNIKKTYVAYHLSPLYEHPDLAADISSALTKRRQGKTCFNFKRADPALFEELAALTARARQVVDAGTS